MLFRSRLANVASIALLLVVLLYLAIIGYGYTLQDHRPPEVRALEAFNRHLKAIGSPLRASIENCKRTAATAEDKRIGVRYFVDCKVNNTKGHGTIYYTAAFGARDQVEFSDTLEMQ